MFGPILVRWQAIDSQGPASSFPKVLESVAKYRAILLTCIYLLQVFGIVQSTDLFKEQHLVMDGCSDVIMEVFGKPVGYHARSAIGTSTLPLDMSVEVEVIVQIKE
jgi:enamine deaminase RidA (YjgF/YER057c/UK114 family)